MNGGYVMVDCTGLDLHAPGTVPGLYAKVKTAIETKKPICLYNLVNAEQTFTGIVAFGGTKSSTSVFVSFYPYTLNISNADVVTL